MDGDVGASILHSTGSVRFWCWCFCGGAGACGGGGAAAAAAAAAGVGGSMDTCGIKNAGGLWMQFL